ncbi:proline dehydrogenase family protein [Flavobacterium sp. xlx-214]|uniref:proline dehydrogenase family protein n=1 Tax=unclassified Flavobacterium TaxID=196869 RepID=UPI0013D1809C|nr:MULTISPECIES: proline dehydrogenase family protein [unclassified Flavobacterium]MBA5793135.1 proline dehydrogenase family protein [Flavobacterium sp. xlx-221]QMI82580.1 proline dehydrogenase family protein [Flavobacterium sp. xlx-214]
MEKIFDNTAVAFALKNNTELNKAYYLFKLISSNTMVKVGTSLTNFAINSKLPVKGLIKSTVFDHFCGGVTEEDCLQVVDKMYTKGVSSVLDYSVEGKETQEQFDHALEMTLKTIEFAKERIAIPFAVFKPTGVGRFFLFEKKGDNLPFTDAEQTEWNRIVERFDIICRTAYEKDVLLLVDAEESWMQDAADDLVLEMMRKYNKEKCIVFNTAQTYRWDRFDFVKNTHAIGLREGFHVGFKVVRGAYMEKERARAEEKGYPSPICATKAQTDATFNKTVTYMVENIDNKMALFAGTHNEESSYMLMELLSKNNLAHNDVRIWFGQLYGMSDNISYNLAHQNYNVAKYLPFGPVYDVVPYLIRRANENTSVAGQTNRELDLLSKELKRRRSN